MKRPPPPAGLVRSPRQQAPLAEEQEEDAGSAGVQAVETGIQVLAAMIRLGSAPMLKTVAEAAGMPPPKAHRYLASYCRTGLVTRQQGGGYCLGPLAVELGLAALRELNVNALALPMLEAARDRLGCTMALAVWGTKGPTFVSVVETHDDVIISVRPGSVLPLLRSATGRVFAAYLPEGIVGRALRSEVRAAREVNPGAGADTQALLDAVRRHGLATVAGDLNPGMHAVAAPVFNHQSSLCAVIVAMGAAGAFDASMRGRNAAAVLKLAGSLSQRLGYVSQASR